jgi:hypothetical protein
MPPPVLAVSWMDRMPIYDLTQRFEKDYARLSADDRKRFKQAVAKFIEDLRRGRGFRPSLRVDGVEGARGVFQMTWAPDGRATFEYGDKSRPGHAHVVWRRVGSHDIFSSP